MLTGAGENDTAVKHQQERNQLTCEDLAKPGNIELMTRGIKDMI